MIELKNYQEEAIIDLRDKCQKILDSSPGTCVFKSPTGSGKTLMVADFIKRLSCDFEKKNKLSYIWISVHNLHSQSKEKLEKYYEGSKIITCSKFEDLDDGIIHEDEILFLNWESVTRKDNHIILGDEQRDNLSEVIENTRKEGRKIVLIIDESHHTAKGEKSQELVNMIKPDLTIEVSATPTMNEIDQLVSVDYLDVIEEEMIKKKVIINSNIDEIKIDADSADEITINAALKKYEQILEKYQELGVNINPLILIQLPDRMSGLSDKKDHIVDILQDLGITKDNNKLAIHLSDNEDKVNLEDIQENDNQVKVLLFKQALALGWDCPRACILVLLRDWRTLEFSIQTIGRIMRTPEQKFYDDDILNKSYLYSNLKELKIAKDIAENYLVIYESKRREELYDKISLPSIYIKRKHEKTRISGKITPLMQKIPENDDLCKKIKGKPTKIINEMMIEGEIKRLDKEQIIISDKTLQNPLFEKDLNGRFELYSRNQVGRFAPKHSSAMIRTALYKFCEHKLGITDYSEVQRLVLSEEFNPWFNRIIANSRDEYEKQVVAKIIQDEMEEVDWSVPESTEYGSLHIKKDYQKSIMQPQYITENQNEMDFMDFIDNPKNNVKWWFKNGTREKRYFAIPYYKDGDIHPFYVDFILKMNDGKIGLFDPKKGFTAKEFDKGIALKEYIDKDSRLFGGLTKTIDNHWRYSDTNDMNDDSTWKHVTDVLN